MDRIVWVLRIAEETLKKIFKSYHMGDLFSHPIYFPIWKGPTVLPFTLF